MTSLVGRERELVMLHDIVARARDERCAQLVTIVAEPGIGKSRLVLELRRALGDDVGWLQSACAPYGDTNAFASMTEVVRELAGLHPGDAADVVEDALAALVARAESAESERAWLRTRLSVLADVTGGEGQVPVAEVASAAARVLEASAADRPLVLTIEDLHWSEPALRDVLSAIVDDADAPLVVLCTARPELFDTDASWGGGRANSTTIRLAPLSDEETSALVETLLSTAIRTESERERVLRNIGGNPLFAIEYVRMLTDTLEVVEADMPVSVQAVIGARLDSVAPPIRAVLQDAAVVGARFWPDALATLGDADDVRGALAELARRGLIVRSTVSWFPEQAEYGFSHTLVREVAYARLPRMTRAGKHAAVGEWLEAAVGDRGEEFADALAHHFEQAVLLADASGERAEADVWRPRAVTWLAAAGDGRAPPRSGRRVRPERARAGDHDRGRPAVRRGPRLLGAGGQALGVARSRRGAPPTAAGRGDPRRQRRQGRGGAYARVPRRTVHGDGPPGGCAPGVRDGGGAARRRARGSGRSSRSSTPGWPRTRCSPGNPGPAAELRGPGARDRGGERAGRDHGPAHPGGFADRARRPRRDRRPARGARSRAGAVARSRRSSRPTATSPIASGRSTVRRRPCSGWTTGARWPIAAAPSARGRGARSPRWSCCSSSAGGTRCSPAPCR